MKMYVNVGNKMIGSFGLSSPGSPKLPREIASTWIVQRFGVGKGTVF